MPTGVKRSAIFHWQKKQQLASCHFVRTPSPSPVVISNTPRASKSPTPVVQAPDHEELTAFFSSLASCKATLVEPHSSRYIPTPLACGLPVCLSELFKSI